ncbi:hypothetical protein [Deinococcus aquatilis]|uniref:hypothetical protein n=1 Tax=Deinococcus aquatilis TaxID=519440 RepID=UPI00038256CC|nr:hypothetical protein [Deinococcus aquatilis]
MTSQTPPVPPTGTFIGGQSVDLSWRLGQALASAERLFGSRDPFWTVLGVEIGDDNFPHTFFLNTAPNHIRVHLANNVGTEIQACYQIGHEVVHLLNPLRPPGAHVLEEGLATWFSMDFSRGINAQYSGLPTLPSYQHALALVAPVVQNLGPLKAWRESNPGQGFSNISANELCTLYPDLAPEVAAALTEPFNR